MPKQTDENINVKKSLQSLTSFTLIPFVFMFTFSIKGKCQKINQNQSDKAECATRHAPDNT